MKNKQKKETNNTAAVTCMENGKQIEHNSRSLRLSHLDII